LQIYDLQFSLCALTCFSRGDLQKFTQTCMAE
jgi:hypothetical protein